MMLASIQLDGKQDPGSLWHFGSRVIVLKYGTQNVQDEVAYSLVQLPPTGPEELRRYSDRGVTLFGGRYAIPDRMRSTDDQERGFWEHNAWVMRLKYQNRSMSIEQSSSVGQNHDDHFVSGVVFPDYQATNTYSTYALGHTTTPGYRTTLDFENRDLWIARLNNNLLYEKKACGSTNVEACMVKKELSFLDIMHLYCDEWYLSSKLRHCNEQDIKEDPTDECYQR